MSTFTDLLKSEIQLFIKDYQGVTTDLLLKNNVFTEVTNKELVQQIQGRRVAVKKLPFLLREGIIYPKNLSLEQASSEATARYKAQELRGKRFADLTCGFGIDAYFLSELFEEVTLVEEQPELLSIVQHNWEVLERKATFVNKKAEAFLADTSQHYDVLYIDPARRDAQQQKKFLLEDLSPNILELQPLLLEKVDKVITKLSPLIDIHYLLNTLNKVACIEVIALRNEVKEVLVIQESHSTIDEVEIRCVNLESEDLILSFTNRELSASEVSYSTPKSYLYIPNNALLKSGAFNYIAMYFGLEKLDINTHLYTSAELKKPFPGRILEVIPIHHKQIKAKSHYNIIAKNYPLSVAELKKKYHLQEGGTDYLIFTRSVSGMEMLLGKEQK